VQPSDRAHLIPRANTSELGSVYDGRVLWRRRRRSILPVGRWSWGVDRCNAAAVHDAAPNLGIDDASRDRG